jgi:V/A-type H+-transporting ATPase subunit B
MLETIKPEYVGVSRISGPIVVVEGVANVGFDELVEVITPEGEVRRGRVLEVERKIAVVQVFEGTSGLSSSETRVRFLGEPLKVPVSTELLGRVMNSLGEPIDGNPKPFTEDLRDVNGYPLNPDAREYPRDFIQTGVSVIDGMCSLVRGQKLPIFSASGLPHNLLAVQIARQAEIASGEDFYIVFAAMGIKHDEATFFRRNLEKGGAIRRVAMFLNLAEDPPTERIVTPRAALTLAEYLAFEENAHVLVILTDMTSYCESLREVSASLEEIPSRKGYPGYMYSDLASIYERTGRIRGGKGSITQLPILSMPNDDITHPVPDLTGYITEGQIVLDRDLHNKGVYPPVNVLLSLSRLMKDGIGADKTREDHADVASQLYAAYSQCTELRSLASIIGEEGLSQIDRAYLSFGENFESKFIKQDETEKREIEKTLGTAWDLLSSLPEEELTRIHKEYLDKYFKKKVG